MLSILLIGYALGLATGAAAWTARRRIEAVTPLPVARVVTARDELVTYGNWTTGAGYLCNETGGNLTATFGDTTLTAVSTPVYSNSTYRKDPQ